MLRGVLVGVQADSHHGLPPALYRLLDPAAAVELPPCGPGRQVPPLDNRELDKLVAGLGRSKATWRRALMLHQWLMVCPPPFLVSFSCVSRMLRTDSQTFRLHQGFRFFSQERGCSSNLQALSLCRLMGN